MSKRIWMHLRGKIAVLALSIRITFLAWCLSRTAPDSIRGMNGVARNPFWRLQVVSFRLRKIFFKKERGPVLLHLGKMLRFSLNKKVTLAFHLVTMFVMILFYTMDYQMHYRIILHIRLYWWMFAYGRDYFDINTVLSSSLNSFKSNRFINLW